MRLLRNCCETERPGRCETETLGHSYTGGDEGEVITLVHPFLATSVCFVRSRKRRYRMKANTSVQVEYKRRKEEKTELRKATYIVAPYVRLNWKAH